MVQTVCTHLLAVGAKKIVLEKPNALKRVFFSVRLVAGETLNHELRMSFDDPLFYFFYTFNGPAKYFEARGEDIFQGNIWVMNSSTVDLQYTATEILH